MRTLRFLPLCVLILPDAFAQSTCGNVQLQLTPDYSLAIGNSSGGSTFSFTLGGRTVAQGPLTQLALFHFDNSLNSTSGIAPAQAVGTSFVPGKFGSAVLVAGTLSYPQTNNLSLDDGTVEMWVSPQFDGSNPVYTAQPQIVFQYWGSNANDQLIMGIANNSTGLYFYAGAARNSAGYGKVSSIAGWKAGEWHHLAFSYSSSQGRVRLYVDGALAQETDAAIQIPSGGPSTFTIGSDNFNHASNFIIDELRISNTELPATVIAYDGTRSMPFADDEVFLSLAGLSPGQLNYSIGGCGSATYNYTGVPISNFSPPSGLLPAGSASVALSFNTLQATACRYSIGTAPDYASMQPLDSGPPTSAHKVVAYGLSTDPRVQDRLYIRCASNTDYVQSATYRVVPASAQPFPRTGNIWVGNTAVQNNPESS